MRTTNHVSDEHKVRKGTPCEQRMWPTIKTSPEYNTYRRPSTGVLLHEKLAETQDQLSTLGRLSDTHNWVVIAFESQEGAGAADSCKWRDRVEYEIYAQMCCVRTTFPAMLGEILGMEKVGVCCSRQIDVTGVSTLEQT